MAHGSAVANPAVITMSAIRHLRTSLAAATIFVCAGSASAQTVQLPTFESFSGGGSVLVPDRGGTSIGKIGRRGAQAGTARPGLSRGQARRVAVGGADVSADIQDLAELDQQVLKEARARREARGLPANHTADKATNRRPAAAETADDEIVPDSSTAASPIESIAEIRRQRAVAAEIRYRQAEETFALGERALSDGATATAKSFYRLAIRYGDADLMNKASARIAAIDQRARDAVVASRVSP